LEENLAPVGFKPNISGSVVNLSYS